MSSLLSIAKELRLAEGVLLSGLTLGAYPFAVDAFEEIHLVALVLLFIGVYTFVISILALNNSAGYYTDKGNSRFQQHSMLSKSQYFYLFLCLVAVALGIFFFLDLLLFRLALVVLFLWLVYYWPKRGLKYKPLTGLGVHLVAQVFQFQMGFVLFTDLSIRSWLLGAFFALLWGGAYLNHEVIDHDADKKSGIKTTTVWLGVDRSIILSLALFSIGTSMLASLYLLSKVTTSEAIPFFMAYVLHLSLLAYLRGKGGIRANATSYRNTYRVLYAGAGVIVLLLKFPW